MEDGTTPPQFGGSIDLAWDFYKCEGSESLISPQTHEKLVAAIKEAGFTYVNSCFHSFGEGQGYSFVSIIGESHVAIHTWPERSVVEITIHYCNYTKNNDALAEKLQRLLQDLFEPGEIDAYPKRVRCLKEASVLAI